MQKTTLRLKLVRKAHTPTATQGYMRMLGHTVPTLEPVWDYKNPEVSCLPPGRYKVIKSEEINKGPEWVIVGGQEFGCRIIEPRLMFIAQSKKILFGSYRDSRGMKETVLCIKKYTEMYMSLTDGLSSYVLEIQVHDPYRDYHRTHGLHTIKTEDYYYD